MCRVILRGMVALVGLFHKSTSEFLFLCHSKVQRKLEFGFGQISYEQYNFLKQAVMAYFFKAKVNKILLVTARPIRIIFYSTYII